MKAIDRIMSGTVTQQRQMMSYQEFVWFILSEEDKGTSTAAEFWFRIMDRDGDGVITLEDLEFFYKEQVWRAERWRVQVRLEWNKGEDALECYGGYPIIKRKLKWRISYHVYGYACKPNYKTAQWLETKIIKQPNGSKAMVRKLMMFYNWEFEPSGCFIIGFTCISIPVIRSPSLNFRFIIGYSPYYFNPFRT